MALEHLKYETHRKCHRWHSLHSLLLIKDIKYLTDYYYINYVFKWQYFGSTGLNIQKLILSLSFLLFKCRFYKNFNSLWGSHLQLTIGFLSDDTDCSMTWIWCLFLCDLYWLFSKASRVSVLYGKTKDSWDQGFVWVFSFLCAFLLVVFFTYAFVFLCSSGCSESQKSNLEKVQKFWRCETLVHVLSLLLPIYWNLGHLLNSSKPGLYSLRREGQGV